MGKLKALKTVLTSLPPRLGHTVGDEKAADRERNVRNRTRAWYGTKRWAELREQVFVRDGFKSVRSGVMCLGKYPADDSPVANHKVPHRGDPKLFWDIDNLETVTKAEHDRIIQAEEQAMPTGYWA